MAEAITKTKREAHVADYKKEIVAKLARLINENPIIAVVNMENLPAPQLQTMRAQLRGKFLMTMTKRRLIKLAIEDTKAKKNGIESLEAHLGGMPALIFTKENPFKLSNTLQKSKSPASTAIPSRLAPHWQRSARSWTVQDWIFPRVRRASRNNRK